MNNCLSEDAGGDIFNNDTAVIHESEQFWLDTFNTITDMITIHDMDFNIVRANRAALRTLNLPASGDNNLKCYTYYHGRKAPLEGCPSCNCHKTGMSTSFEIFEPHLEKYVEVRAIPRFDADKNIIGSIHIVRDISERIEIMEQHKNSEKRFKILFEYAPDTIFLLDLKGKIIDGNKVSEKMTGYRVDELVGRNIIDINLISKNHIPKAIKNIAKGAVGLPTGPDEYSLYRKDGSNVLVEVRSYTVKIDNKTQILGIARDITSRKNIEAQLKSKVEDLEKFYEMAIGREVKMKELKDELSQIKEELARCKNVGSEKKV